MNNISNLDIANLRAMKKELLEKIKLNENSNPDVAIKCSDDLNIIESEINKRMNELGTMLNS